MEQAVFKLIDWHQNFKALLREVRLVIFDRHFFSLVLFLTSNVAVVCHYVLR